MEAGVLCSGPWLPLPAFESMGAGARPSMAGGSSGPSGWLGVAAASWAPTGPPRHRPVCRGRTQGGVRAWFLSGAIGVSQRVWVGLCTPPSRDTPVPWRRRRRRQWGCRVLCSCTPALLLVPRAPGLCSHQLPSASLGCEPTAASCLASPVTKTCLTHLFVMLPGLIPQWTPSCSWRPHQPALSRRPGSLLPPAWRHSHRSHWCSALPRPHGPALGSGTLLCCVSRRQDVGRGLCAGGPQ